MINNAAFNAAALPLISPCPLRTPRLSSCFETMHRHSCNHAIIMQSMQPINQCKQSCTGRRALPCCRHPLRPWHRAHVGALPGAGDARHRGRGRDAHGERAFRACVRVCLYASACVNVSVRVSSVKGVRQEVAVAPGSHPIACLPLRSTPQGRLATWWTAWQPTSSSDPVAPPSNHAP